MRSMFVSDQLTGRRDLLLGISGLALAATGGATFDAAAEAVSPSEAPFDPKDTLYTFGKIWSGYDEPVVGAFHGVMYLRAGDRAAVPVFGFTGTGVSQARLEADGSITLKSRETGYFTDLATGEVLETWLNPFTGERVEVYHFYDDRLLGHMTKAHPPAVEFQPLGSDQLMMSWDYAKSVPNPVTPEGWPSYSTGKTISPSEHFTFYVSKAECLDLSAPTARTRGAFSRMSQCWPFMKMGQSPLKDATLFGRMFTHKGLPGYGDVPRKVLAYMEKHASLYLEVPPGWGAPGEIDARRLDTFMTFAADIPPETPGYPWRQQAMTPGLAPPTGLGARYRTSQIS